MIKTTYLEFEYELPSGMMITVHANHTPGLPERRASLNHAGDPGDEGEMEIECCEFHGEEIDLEGLWFFESKDSPIQISIDQDIQEKAWEVLEN